MPISDAKYMLPRRSCEVRYAGHRAVSPADTAAENKSTIMDDPFIKQYIGELLRSLRTQYLIDLIKPYTRLELTFLAKVCHSFHLRCTELTGYK